MPDDGMLTRRSLRHLLVRRHNERVAAARDDRWPVALWMSSETATELLVDDDPAETRVIDFEGRMFMGIAIVRDERLGLGVIEVDWPADPPLPPGAVRAPADLFDGAP